MTEPNILSAPWLSLLEAAGRLQQSTRSVERKARAGYIRTVMQARSGARPERLYSAEDVEHLLLPFEPEAGVVGDAAMAVFEPAPAPLPSPATKGSRMPQAVELLLTQQAELTREAREHPSLTERFYLTLEEAHKLSGLSRALLLRAAKSGTLKALKDPAWKFSRISLASFDPAPDANGTRLPTGRRKPGNRRRR